MDKLHFLNIKILIRNGLKNIVFVLFSVILLQGCKAHDNYNIRISNDDYNRKSKLLLMKNGKDIDSMENINSYYGHDSIVYNGKNIWSYYYKGRCGTGCSVSYVMIITYNDDKLKKMLHILNKEKTYDIEHKIEKTYIPYFNENDLFIKKEIRILGKKKEEKIVKLEYDLENNIYYNIIYDDLSKGINIDDENSYIYEKENVWKYYIKNYRYDID